MTDIPASPHTHPVISSLSDAQLTVLVEAIRDRRLRLNQMYMEVKRIRKDSLDSNMHEQIDKHLIHFVKAIAAIEKAVEKAMERANKIIALQLQLGVDTDDASRLIAILKGEEK